MKKLFRKMEGRSGIHFVYLFVLAYTILALVWWGVLLFNQSEQITGFEIRNLELRIDNAAHPMEFRQELERIHSTELRRFVMYLSEGLIFLAIILLGGFFVYRSIWKQMRLSQQQQNFMMAVTHELKSPIAAAKLNLETLRKHKLDEEKRLKLLDNTIRETNRLDQLCNNILLASQMEAQRYQLFREDIDFSALLETGIREMQSRISTHTIQAHILPDVWVNGDKFMLQILLSNLVENAVKYAPKHTVIDITLEESSGSMLKLKVTDEGPGIPVDERERIFLKFYRIGNENTRRAKGSGLGLFLSRKIVQQHGGAIVVKDNVPAGAIFEITWPVYSIQRV
ncbi:sensor histidine kinase KdpD [Chitinophaga sp. CF418]|uniref:sensor histidine kinase n=1 Tax=Chitinophaga sp. CF418 TaxID=1855287 RepID=UPI00091B04C7|nr:ATP-binding protein [Chitinophaga sp. CF418]SHM49563.1 His Kinase A (phospho-acceptor) domain-containing protein [Chitinophaga sp. CF418]